MSSDAEITVYAKRKLSRTNKERFVPIMNSYSADDIGGPVLPHFLREYPHPKRKWDPDEIKEITLDEIRAYVKASQTIVEMHNAIIPGGDFMDDFDFDNEEHKKLFDKICELFYMDDDDDMRDYLKAVPYKLDCIKRDLPFLEEILHQAHIHETKGEEIYITLEYI